MKKGEVQMSQNERILNYLKKHKKGITPAEAYEKFGCLRLSARIFDLREEGNKISSTIIEVKNRVGDPVHVALYRLMEN